MPARWKGLQLDYTTLQSFDTLVQIPVCLTQKQVAILKALLIPAYWDTRWINLSITPDQLQAEMAQLDSQLDGNDCEACEMEFRDNPDEPCEVQYSNDGGETWTTMFRKDNCPVNHVSSVTNISTYYDDRDTITTNNTTWNNDILNVAPEWEWTDPYSDRALCWAIGFYVDAICDIASAEIQKNNAELRKTNDWLDDVAFILAGAVIANMAAAGASGGITIPVLLVTAVTWATVRVVDAVWDELVSLDYDQFEDMDARDEVKCAMWNYLRGETPQWDDWVLSLDTFITVEPNAQAIRDVVNVFNSDVDVYINFLMAMEEINDVSASLPECDCPQLYVINQCYGPGGERYGFEYTAATSLAFSNPGDTPAVCPGSMWWVTDLITGVPSSIGGVGGNVRVTLPTNSIVVNIQVKWRAYRKSESSAGDKNAAIWVGEPYDDGVYVGGHSWGVAQDIWQVITTHVDTPGGMTATPRSHVYIHNSIDRPNGEIEIVWIHIECVPYTP